MRLLIETVVLVLLLGCNQEHFQKISDEELLRHIVEDDWPDLNDLEILNFEGVEISLDSLMKLEVTGQYFEDFYVNRRGELVRIVIRERTPKDEKLLAIINENAIGKPIREEGSELNPVTTDCLKKTILLQEVFDKDQGMRKGVSNIDSNIDHGNLEIVVSL